MNHDLGTIPSRAKFSLRFDAALYTQPALRDRGDLDADAELAALLRGDDDVEDEPTKRTCCGRRAKEKEEERAVRRASLAGRRMTLRVPDAQRPTAPRGRSGARVSARLSMAYRGEADFFCRRRGRERRRPARRPPRRTAPSSRRRTRRPPAAADERDAARSALRRLQEMDSGSSDLATQPTDEPDITP